MSTVSRVLSPFKYSPLRVGAALFLALVFSQSVHASRHHYVANLGELDAGSLTPIASSTHRKTGYLFTLATDGIVTVDIDANHHWRRTPKVRLWDTDTHTLLGKNGDIQDLALLSDTKYKLVVSGRGHGRHHRHHFGYEGTIAVNSPSEVPLPAGIWLFGSALLGLASLVKKRSAQTQ
jgi:hypothetical protein